MTDYCKTKIKEMIIAMSDEEIEVVVEALKEKAEEKESLDFALNRMSSDPVMEYVKRGLGLPPLK